MSNGEFAPNPQSPPLLQNLQESAELINTLEMRSNGLRVHVPGATYGLNRYYKSQNPERAIITLAWANSGDLLTSDGRKVSSMNLDVQKTSAETNDESAQTYRFVYTLAPVRRHEVLITVDNHQQQADIAHDPSHETPAHWPPMSDTDIVMMLNVFHDALQEGKLLDEEVTREIREHNELLEYIRARWPECS